MACPTANPAPARGFVARRRGDALCRWLCPRYAGRCRRQPCRGGYGNHTDTGGCSGASGRSRYSRHRHGAVAWHGHGIMPEDDKSSADKSQKSHTEKYEITTLRRDVRGDGRHAEVVFGRDWHEDAMRRDLTINAVYADRHGTVYDPTGCGLADIAARRVRFIGEPAQRIREDYLRILRFVRFYFRLSPDVAPDAQTVAAINQAGAQIATLSGERRQSEFMKILALAEVEKAVDFLARVGALETTLGGEGKSGDGAWQVPACRRWWRMKKPCPRVQTLCCGWRP